MDKLVKTMYGGRKSATADKTEMLAIFTNLVFWPARSRRYIVYGRRTTARSANSANRRNSVETITRIAVSLVVVIEQLVKTVTTIAMT